MPHYTYKREDTGEAFDLFMTITEMMDREDEDGRITLEDGTHARRDFMAEHGHFKEGGRWPLYSDAMGVHPSQISEQVAADKKAGVPINYTPDGRAIYESASQRKRHCEAHGFYDRNGGYGDPQRR